MKKFIYEGTMFAAMIYIAYKLTTFILLNLSLWKKIITF
jgi:hypothetical protein